MAHGLDSEDGEAAMFYVGKQHRHGLGTERGGPFSVRWGLVEENAMQDGDRVRSG